MELLPYAWQRCQQHPHRHVVPSPRSIAQPKCNKDKYNGRQHGGPAQDDSAASGCIPPRLPQAPTPMMWQQPTPPMSFTPMMATMHPMMLITPYQAINYMGHQFGHPSPQFGPPPPAVAPPGPPPTPSAGMMMPYYNPYLQPPNF